MSYENFDPNDLLIQAHSTKPEGNFGPHRIPHGIRAIHLPTGTVVSCDEDRSQHKNRHLALTQLWDLVQGKPSYAELAAQVEVLRSGLNQAIELLVTALVEPQQITDAEIFDLRQIEQKIPAACIAQVRAEAVIAAVKSCVIVECCGVKCISVYGLIEYAERIRQGGAE